MEREKPESLSDEGMLQIISFLVGDEEYGLDIRGVKEVIRATEITRLPRAPSFVKGVINLRGDVIPIVDLRERFGLGAGEATAATRVIVLLNIDRILSARETEELVQLEPAVAQ